MAYQIRSNLHLPVFDRTGVTCISPTGENERGLKFIGRSNMFLPFGKVRMGYPTGENERGLKMIGRRDQITIVHRKAYRKRKCLALSNPNKSKPKSKNHQLNKIKKKDP